MRASALALALALAACATSTPAIDGGVSSDAAPSMGRDADLHIPECRVVGDRPYCPPGYPVVCPNGAWSRPGNGVCYAVAYMGEQPPACTSVGDIGVVPHCAHGVPYCLPPDPSTGCPD